MKSKTPFTKEYFQEEIVRFRDMFGTKSFWQDNIPANAMRGLLYVYVNTKDLQQSDIDLMQTTILEYDMRLSLVLANNLYKNENKS